MQTLIGIGAVLIGYILGSIPFGLLIVKIKTGKDIREIESGRTGGTNAMRAAGFWAGLLTAIMDIMKGAGAVWIAEAMVPTLDVIHLLAPVAAIIGHNYSIFLLNRDEDGKLRFHGGAGGAPALGGAVGFWPWSLPIVFILGASVFFTLGIASVTTMSVAFFVTVIFAIRAYMGLMPWTDVLYGILAGGLLLWALRPNIRKLLAGNERVVKYSLNGWLRAKKEAQAAIHK
ncbi:MAG: glycerol-3-phosphate acyltransferase [Anaerolineales bacterium]